MAVLSEKHRRDVSLGKGICSVPMWMMGCPAGFCNKPAYGEPTEAGRRYYGGYVPRLACPGHGGPTLKEAIAGRTVIRFDGPPGPESGRFVEVERDGKSVCFGDWVQNGDGWLLVLPKDSLGRVEVIK